MSVSVSVQGKPEGTLRKEVPLSFVTAIDKVDKSTKGVYGLRLSHTCRYLSAQWVWVCERSCLTPNTWSSCSSPCARSSPPCLPPVLPRFLSLYRFLSLLPRSLLCLSPILVLSDEHHAGDSCTGASTLRQTTFVSATTGTLLFLI